MLSLSFSKLTTVEDQNALFLSFERVVVQKFLDQIHVTHEHASTAVSLQLQRVQRVLLGVIRLQQIEVRVPLVSNHLFMRGEREREREIASDHSRKDHATGRTTIDRLIGLFFAIIVAKKRRRKKFLRESIDRYKITSQFLRLSLSNERRRRSSKKNTPRRNAKYEQQHRRERPRSNATTRTTLPQVKHRTGIIMTKALRSS